MRKIILVALALVAVAIGAGVAFLTSNLDGIVKKVIEAVGTEVAGVKVSVGEVKISLTEGKASISGLTVANPPGFAGAHAFSLGNIAVALDTGSLGADPIVVKDVAVAAPRVSYELGTGGTSNLDAIRKNVAAKSGGGGDKASSSEGGKKLVIDRLFISKGSVALAAPVPGMKAEAALADITLTGIGRKSGGASAAEIATQVLDALTKSALKAGQSLTVGNVGDMVKGAVPSDGLKGILGR